MLLLIAKQVLKGEKVDGAFGTGKTLNSGLIILSIIFEIIISIIFKSIISIISDIINGIKNIVLLVLSSCTSDIMKVISGPKDNVFVYFADHGAKVFQSTIV